MKTKYLFTKTAFIAVCLGAAVSCFAQGKAAKGLFEATRPSRGTIQRFVFPQQTVTNIRAGIKAGKFDSKVTQKVAQNVLPPLNVSTATQNHLNRSLITGMPVEKEVLIMAAKERAFYAPEIDAARAIRQQILDITVLTDEGQLALAQNIQDYIKNHTLKVLLLEELEICDIYNMALDLTDYFSLDKPFEDAAFDYTIRHPHQMNLNMRRLIYNPLVDDALKNRLKYFLESQYIPPAEYQSFKMAIHTAHMQYKRRLEAAQESDLIKAQIEYYQDVTTRLSDFIVQTGRRPKWNTRSAKEFDLNDEIEWIMFNDHINKFPQILPFSEALQTLYEQAPTPTILSLEQTIALYEEFVKTTHRRYPHVLKDRPQKGEIAFEQEETLWDSLEYWRIENESVIHPHLVRILNQYPNE